MKKIILTIITIFIFIIKISANELNLASSYNEVITKEEIQRLAGGVDIGGYVTAPCEVELVNSKEGYITLHEGKYHQIKLMLKAVCNKIIYLERVKFGPISLDKNLARGEWRFLNDEEQKALEEAGKFRN